MASPGLSHRGLHCVNPCGTVPIESLDKTVLLTDEDATYFLVPECGGETLETDGQTIRTITPLGGALIGHRQGDEVVLPLPGGPVRATVSRLF